MTDREVMQMALERLEIVALQLLKPQDVKVVQALRAALEQPEQGPLTDEQGRPMTYWGGKAQPPQQQAEPVTHLHEWFSTGAMGPGKMRCIHCGAWGNDASLTIPPAPQRSWVGLTDEERNSLWRNNAPTHLMKAIEAKLKEKNHE